MFCCANPPETGNFHGPSVRLRCWAFIFIRRRNIFLQKIIFVQAGRKGSDKLHPRNFKLCSGRTRKIDLLPAIRFNKCLVMRDFTILDDNAKWFVNGSFGTVRYPLIHKIWSNNRATTSLNYHQKMEKLLTRKQQKLHRLVSHINLNFGNVGWNKRNVEEEDLISSPHNVVELKILTLHLP